jgi:hypothetical protein
MKLDQSHEDDPEPRVSEAQTEKGSGYNSSYASEFSRWLELCLLRRPSWRCLTLQGSNLKVRVLDDSY